MPPHRPWMDLPEYQHVESNPNPHFRPSISALVTKLRKLSALKDQPASVEFVAHDLIYQYLYKEQPRPFMIWRMLVRLEALWRMSLRKYVETEDYRARTLPDGTRQSYPVVEDEELFWRMLGDPEKVPVLVPNEQEPSVVFVEPAHPNEEDFKSERLKEGVQQVIYHHSIDSWSEKTTTCRCGKQFKYGSDRVEPSNATWKWAKHLRIQIWKYMLESFIYDEVPQVQGSADQGA